MKKVLSIVLISISLNTHAQINFQEGYIINNNNSKVECLIKNHGWTDNPNEIEYKLREDAEVNKGLISSIKEFEIYNTKYKYVRFNVDLDESSNNSSNLSTSESPKLVNKTLFLRALVTGDASLYGYFGGKGQKKYFYTKKNISANPLPLTYKKYIDKNGKIRDNNIFKQTLYENLKCPSASLSEFRKADYNTPDLAEIFINYNTCNNSEYKAFLFSKGKNKINLKLKGGVTFSNLKAQYRNNQEYVYEKELNFIFGIETEYVFAANKNKWSIFTELNYQNYKSEGVVSYFALSEGPPSNPGPFEREFFSDSNTDISYLEIPLGVRHYFYISDKSKLYANIGIGVNIVLNKSITFENTDDFTSYSGTKSAYSSASVLFGVGYMYNDRFSLETRFHSRKEVISENSWVAELEGAISFALGYKML